MTAARMEANRQNAKLSTGPRTVQGKTASSRNSLCHGLTSERLILPGEDPADYQRLRDIYLHDLQPANELELTLAEQVATARWRLQRVYRLETSFFANRIEAITTEHPEQSPDDAFAFLLVDPSEMARMKLFLRYLAAAEHAYNKAMADFRAAQAERRKTEREESLVESWLAPPSEPAPVPSAPPTPKSTVAGRGFVSHEIPKQHSKGTPAAPEGQDTSPGLS